MQEVTSHGVANLLQAIRESLKIDETGRVSMPQLNLFRDAPDVPQLCHIKTHAKQKPTADPKTWEVISAVVDSGATIGAIKPETGEGYPVEESEASTAGVEYETARKETLPNLG